MNNKFSRIVRALAHAIIVSILLILALVPSRTALGAGAITASASSGFVGSVVTITATAFFLPSTPVNITFGSTVFNLTSNTSGGFVYPLTVPTVPYGTYNIVANDSGSSSNTISFSVGSDFVLNPVTAYVGSVVSITATGFNAGASCTVTFDGTTVLTTTFDSSGRLESSFSVPHATAGLTHNVTVTDGTHPTTKQLALARSVIISPSSGAVGTSVVVTGTAYSSTAAIRVTFDSTEMALTTSDGVGDFRVIIAIPATSGGAHSITASDGLSSAAATFTISSGVALSSTSGFAGAAITASGSAFAAFGTVTLKMDETQLVQVAADSNGGFSTSFTVPTISGGAHTFTASDSSFTVTSTFTVLTSIKVSPASGKVGTQVTIIGTGFSAGASVGVSFDGAILATVSAGSNGSFNADITAPASPAGSHQISASDGTRTASSAFSLAPSIAVSPAQGVMGAQATLTGSGFAANTAITISAISTANNTIKTARTDAKGGFAERITIPALDAATYTLTVSDGTNSASVPFKVTASFNISASTGAAGSAVTVSGTGFDGTVTVKFDETVVATTTATTLGAFSATFDTPQSVQGAHTILVSDGSKKLQLPFDVKASFDISPKSGNVGSTVTMTGSGFSGLISVKYDDTEVASVAAGVDGQFSTTFTAPVSIHGDHTVSIANSTVNPVTFSMDSISPPAPVITEPETGSREGSEPTFTWDSVSDPSGVTYTFQLATGADFTKPLIERTGLKNTRYNLNDQEKLDAGGKQAPYYLRVKAVDRAQNESGWSEISTFYVTVLPVWAPYAIGVAVVGLVLLFIKLFRRRLHWLY